ncbi:class II aaRS and biotin synthetase [Colletotrichum somersetense]|nr:class II aaRS and biotin synthetase [Colletotrichum somersetense]
MKVSVISLAITLTSALVAAIPQPEVFSLEENPAQILRRQTTGDNCKTQCGGPCRGVQNVANSQCNDDGSAICQCKTSDINPPQKSNSPRQAPPPPPTGNTTPQVICKRKCISKCGSILKVTIRRICSFHGDVGFISKATALHEEFKVHRFVEISTPLITPSILHELSSAIHIPNLKTAKPCYEISFGQNIPNQAKDALNNHFGGHVWLMYKSRCLEQFPYRTYPDDEELTMTADLIASGGFGEICGVVEKASTREEILLRLKEKGKAELRDVYGWVLQFQDFDMVPLTAFGMGFERVLKWFCGTGHVQDMIPFPRIFGRDPTP